MGRIKEYFYNTECDCCGAICNEETWYSDEVCADEDLIDHNWIKRGGKYYCECCWELDDNDNVVTADGKVWDGDTDELIAELKK